MSVILDHDKGVGLPVPFWSDDVLSTSPLVHKELNTLVLWCHALKFEKLASIFFVVYASSAFSERRTGMLART